MPWLIDSFLFLLCSLTFIACILYLPQHVQFIINRAWFYIHGDSYEGAATAVGQLLSSTTAAAVKATAEAVREL